jgi:predicted RNase H-like HicB family nuclease
MTHKRKLSTKEYSFTAIYEPVGKSGYQVTVPLLPGLITYGRTFDEARMMARDAIVCHIQGLLKGKNEIPSEHSLFQEKVTVSLS